VDRSADDRDPFFNAAASISDGADIDWTDVERAAVDDETTAIVVQLQVVEQIARVHSGSCCGGQVRGSTFGSKFWFKVRGRGPGT
jgi:hypothetical protein